MHATETLRTTEQVASHYKVSTKTVRNWVASGAPAIRLPKGLRFEEAALREWLLEQAPREVSGERR
jgi:transposase